MIFYDLNSCFTMILWVLILILTLAALPVASAAPLAESPFPSITFKVFSDFFTQHFSSKTPLSTVLVILFSLIENPDLLSLHARQQYSKTPGENAVTTSGWIKALARALKEDISHHQRKPLKLKGVVANASEDEQVTALGVKLNDLSHLLGLYSYDQHQHLRAKLKPVSHQAIRPVHVISPISMECETESCNSRALRQMTPSRDIPRVTLIKNSAIYEDVHVLTGQCPVCKTKYVADHERAVEENEHSRVYLKSAKYLKVGQSLWVDRNFSSGVLNGTYTFHASVSAYAEFWNNSFHANQQTRFKGVTRCQIWQAFVQETIRTITSASGVDLILRDGLMIDDVVTEAFEILGSNGIIAAAGDHSCSECTQEYKESTDIIAAAGGGLADEPMQDESVEGLDELGGATERMAADRSIVTMAVLDGIVMGPAVCLTVLYLKFFLT
jgi:hypothetical protein